MSYKTKTENLEFTCDEGKTWQPCIVMGRHEMVEMIPCYIPATHGYKFIHPQCLRYQDSKESVYNQGEQPERIFAYSDLLDVWESYY